MDSTPPIPTKQRILAAAEELFAQHGFDGASLRQVTASAGVNLAAVNYHFGSKSQLIEEIFRHRLDDINGRRLLALHKIAGKPETVLEDVIAAYVRPAVELSGEGEGSVFMRVMARAYAEHDDTLRRFLSENYGHVMRQFVAEFGRLLPELGKEDLYWRIDLMTGALTHAMSGFGMIQRKSDIPERQHREKIVEQLLRFTASGLRHP
ncbi:TetR/AcrR family transcriptional regulator [Frateuria aurantia]|uniref:Transcriptional regulator n=1 Tax=Frateuria aurantia (strain ATCC 33424 / DSM 6220 / KCTC 2777 / LMG 1558 / NBRC 3245 / NCIMB 13370) TaxID=767434 RepID=H8L2P4_FRAAD|nr:TetR/AcrR family transcriptional regulator [Frateuria aurantia]AFC86403.1 transcriptional regulator [Frateuria aurantia DSM 6220]